jgi:cytidylate kinase
MEGRDIGTVVFSNAELKIFLKPRPKRANVGGKNISKKANTDLEQVLEGFTSATTT